jgi:hypothetical protein
MSACRRHYPGRSVGTDSLALLHRRRPSPHYSWVGSCITFFEACSAFTQVITCRLAKSPYATLYTGGSGGFVASTAAPIATGWSDPVPGRAFLPAVVQRLSRRTVMEDVTTVIQPTLANRGSEESDYAEVVVISGFKLPVARQRHTRLCAAAVHSGYRNWKPASTRLSPRPVLSVMMNTFFLYISIATTCRPLRLNYGAHCACLKPRETPEDDDRRYVAAKLVNIAQPSIDPKSRHSAKAAFPPHG